MTEATMVASSRAMRHMLTPYRVPLTWPTTRTNPLIHQCCPDRSGEIAQRLENDPLDLDAKLDQGVDESMDASDPPASTAPGAGRPLYMPD